MLTKHWGLPMPLSSRRKFIMGLGALGTMSGLGVLRFFALPSESKEYTQSVLKMGTFLTITIRHSSTARRPSTMRIEEAFGHAFQTAAEYEAIFSRHADATPLAILNTQGSLRDAPNALLALLQQSIQFSRKTNNAFNPAIVPALQALEQYTVPTLAQLPASILHDVTRLANPRNISIKGNVISFASKEMSISLDGIAKGYIVDRIAQVLEQHGIHDYLVNGGGDIRTSVSSENAESWDIGVQDAASPKKCITTIRLRKAALASSGNYESLASHGYQHLITFPLNVVEPSLTSATVIAPTCVEADAMATALFAMSPQKSLAFINAYSALYASMVQTTEGFMISNNWEKWT